MNEFKQQVLEEYLVWVNQTTDDLPDKIFFTAEEVVDKVTDIVLSKVNTFKYSED